MSVERIQKRSREKFYRGLNAEKLKGLDTREFSRLVKSRERRTILRNFNVIERFVKKCEVRSSKNRPIRTQNRSLVVVPAMLGKIIFVYNGREYIKVQIIEEMLGHRLGEFAPTRKTIKHGSAGVGATKSSASRSVK